MGGGGLQLIPRGDLGGGGVMHARLAVVVPDGEDASHGDVDPSAREVVHLLGVAEHVQDTAVHRDGTVLTLHQLVDGTEVFQPLVSVVDGEQAVILTQGLQHRVGHGVELGLALCIARDGGDGVEVVEGVGGEFLGLTATGGQGETCEEEGRYECTDPNSFHVGFSNRIFKSDFQKMGGRAPHLQLCVF